LVLVTTFSMDTVVVLLCNTSKAHDKTILATAGCITLRYLLHLSLFQKQLVVQTGETNQVETAKITATSGKIKVKKMRMIPKSRMLNEGVPAAILSR
jgi:hypothetical protein